MKQNIDFFLDIRGAFWKNEVHTGQQVMDWTQFVALFFTIMVPLMGASAFFYRQVNEWRMETRAETQSIRDETQSIREEIRQQVARSDRLYEMFIDLLKSQSGKL